MKLLIHGFDGNQVNFCRTAQVESPLVHLLGESLDRWIGSGELFLVKERPGSRAPNFLEGSGLSDDCSATRDVLGSRVFTFSISRDAPLAVENGRSWP